MILLELFNTTVPFKVTKNTNTDYIAQADVSNGKFIFTAQLLDGIWDIKFSVGDSFDKTGKGAAMEVFATVVKISADFITKKKPTTVGFSSKGDSRTSLYKSMMKKLFKGWHYSLLPGFEEGETLFILSKNKDEPLPTTIKTSGKGRDKTFYARIPLYGHTIDLIGVADGDTFNVSPVKTPSLEPSALVRISLTDTIKKMSERAKIKNVVIRKDLQKYLK